MRKWLALGVQVPFIAMMWVACSSDNTGTGDGGDASQTQDVKAADKKVIPDVSVPEEGPGCAPSATIDTSKLTWSPPIPSNACSAQQITDFNANCFDSTTASTAKCTAWTGTTANKACAGCMETSESVPNYGAIIDTGHGVVYANIGGCIAIVAGDLTAGGCGAKFWATSQCEDLDCADNCPITDNASFTAYQQCTTAAATGACKVYADAECDTSPDAGVIYTKCSLPLTTAKNFSDLVLAYGPVFCGGLPDDGGTSTDGGSSDAASDAPVDAPPG